MLEQRHNVTMPAFAGALLGRLPGQAGPRGCVTAVLQQQLDQRVVPVLRGEMQGPLAAAVLGIRIRRATAARRRRRGAEEALGRGELALGGGPVEWRRAPLVGCVD